MTLLLLGIALAFAQDVPVSMPNEPVKIAAICTTVALSVIPAEGASLAENNALISAWTARYAKLAGIPDDDRLTFSPGMDEASEVLSGESNASLEARLKWCRAHKPQS